MNKYLILLGLMLLACLSFADLGSPQDWMQIVEGKYSCAYDYNYALLNMAGSECKMFSEGEFFSALGTYFECRGCMLDNVYTMRSSAGCSRAPTDPVLFRSGMAAFNANAFLFRQVFVAKMGACLRGPECGCDGEEVMAYMGGLRSEYLGCISEMPMCREPVSGGSG